MRSLPVSQSIADAVGERLAPLLLHRLALARGERGEEVVIGRKAFVEEMELLVGAVQEAGALPAPRTSSSCAKVTCAEETPSFSRHRLQARRQAGLDGADVLALG